MLTCHLPRMHSVLALTSADSASDDNVFLQPKGPDKKRQRVHKPQAEAPDSWTQKGMKVIDVIWNKKLSHIFREPVKPTADFAPDYFSIIKHPMDLSTVRSKLRNGDYTSVEEFEVVQFLLCASLGIRRAH